MNLIDAIKSKLTDISGEWTEKNGVFEFRAVIAERKSFLNTKKLTYSAKLRIDDEKKHIKFTEMLIESGFGLSGGTGDDMSPGFGFKAESFNTLTGARVGTIKEQSNLFGKKYDYQFEWSVVRKKVEEIAKNNKYTFSYQVTSIGL